MEGVSSPQLRVSGQTAELGPLVYILRMDYATTKRMVHGNN